MERGRRKRRATLLGPALVALAAIAVVPASQAGPKTPGPPAKLLQQMEAAVNGGAGALKDEEPGELEEEESEHIMARAAFDAARTSAPGASVPAGAVREAIARAAAIPTVGGRWSELTDVPYLNDPIPGYPIESFSNWGAGWGVVSGRMTALATSGNDVYAGGADGGVWKTTDLGKTWKYWSRGLPRISVGDLRTNPADGSVWVGLGEPNTNSDANSAMGIYRLAKGASAWERVGGTEVEARNTYEIRFIGRYAFAATHKGLLRRVASDTSAPWQVVLKPDPNPKNSPYRTSHITSVVAVPGSGGESVLAALGWRGGSLPSDTRYNGFYVSDASGAAGTFHRVTLRGAINPETVGRTTFSTGGNRIYAVIEDSSTVSLFGQGVYVSTTGPAGPWRLLADSAKLQRSGSALEPPPDGYFPGIAAWYNQYVQVDPDDPMHVYIGLEEVFESLDGGRTWFAIGAYWNYTIPCANGGADPYNCPNTTHPDQHSIAFLGDRVFVGGDGGVWHRLKSQHGRRGWVNTNATLHTLQYYSVALGRLAGGDAIYGGLQDNGGSLLRPAPRPRFVNNFTGDGGDTIVDRQNGNRVVNEYVYLDMALSLNQGTHDLEISPSCLSATEPPDPCDPNPQFIAPFEEDPVAPNRHWVAGGAFVWESHRGWNTRCAGDRCDWKIVYDAGGEGPEQSITDLGVNGKTVYAGWCAGGTCDPGAGFRFTRGVSTNYGGAWHEASTVGLPNRYITGVTVDRKHPAHAYLTFGSYRRRWIDGAGFGHVFETRNGGKSWTNISGNLPDSPFHDLVIWHGNLVAASDVGVFITKQYGNSQWKKLGAGLPPVRVWEINTSPRGDYLVAGTHGRGLWRIDRP
jgi:hypothetical protein